MEKYVSVKIVFQNLIHFFHFQGIPASEFLFSFFLRRIYLLPKGYREGGSRTLFVQDKVSTLEYIWDHL